MIKQLLSRHETYVALAIVIFSIVITAINPAYLTLRNFLGLFQTYAFWGVLAVGVLVVLISGGIDISFTAIATVAEYVMATIMLRFGGDIFTSLLIAASIGIVLGLINAVFIHYFKIPTIITTIATLNVYYGVLIAITHGSILHSFPSWFNNFGNMLVFTIPGSHGGSPYGMSVLTAIWIAIIVIVWFILQHTRLGRAVYAIGGNAEAARRVGFNIVSIQMFVYGFMGLIGGIAGFMHGLMIGAAEPNSIYGHELDVIAMVVLGGANLAGGKGTITGTILGVVLIAIMGNGLTIMRVSSYWHNLIIGVIIVVSVSFSAYRGRRAVVRRSVSKERTEAVG